jgi:hypothetical protein
MDLFLGGALAVIFILGFHLWKSISRLYWSTRASIRERDAKASAMIATSNAQTQDHAALANAAEKNNQRHTVPARPLRKRQAA